MKLRALVIGAGRIGARYDSPDSKEVLSHCGAYSRCAETDLVGVVDSDPRQAESAARVWKTHPYESVAQGIVQANPDIVSVCVPPELHLPIVQQVVGATAPGYVFLEKPIANELKDARTIAALLKDVPCTVNYLRRFAPGIVSLRSRIRANEFGKFVSGSAFYSKGIRNNGSHLIDLFHFLFDEINRFRIVSAVEDYSAADPTLGVVLKIKGDGWIHLIPADERHYSVFHCDFLFEKARVSLAHFGFEMGIQVATGDPRFSGYKSLQAGIASTETGLDGAMLHAVRQIVVHLSNGIPTASTLSDAMKTEELVSQIVAGHQNGSCSEELIQHEK